VLADLHLQTLVGLPPVVAESEVIYGQRSPEASLRLRRRGITDTLVFDLQQRPRTTISTEL
jgi:hypothetical protein